MKTKVLFRILTILLVVNVSIAHGQLTGVGINNDKDKYGLVDLAELENVIDSCYSQTGIGAALNYLSNYTWELNGAGQNVTNGDSLFFKLRSGIKNKDDYYAWVIDYKYDLVDPKYPDVKMYVSEYLLQFQFKDKKNVENIINDIVKSGYIKTKDELFSKSYSVVTYEKNDRYVVRIATIVTDDEGTIYFYQILGKID